MNTRFQFKLQGSIIKKLQSLNTDYTSSLKIYKILSLLSLFIMNSLTTSLTAQAEIEGKWRDNDKGVVILIYEEEGKYFGQLIELDDQEANQKIQAAGKIIILRDFEKESESKFCCGKIYQPKKKKSFSASLVLEDEMTLKIKVKKGIMKRTQTWTRV